MVVAGLVPCAEKIVRKRLPGNVRLKSDSHARDSFIRSEEHTSELQSQSNLVCRLLLEKKKKTTTSSHVTMLRRNEAILHLCLCSNVFHSSRLLSMCMTDGSMSSYSATCSSAYIVSLHS